MSARSVVTAGKARRVQNIGTVAAPVKLNPFKTCNLVKFGDTLRVLGIIIGYMLRSYKERGL